MNNKNVLLDNCSVREGIQILDSESEKYVCIINENDKLIGIFTQGDMRKYLLNNGDISAPITEAVNSKPKVFTSIDAAKAYSVKHNLVVYPVVDDEGKLKECYIKGESTWDNLMKKQPLKNIPVVIMAGGKGTRLYPYTKILPKALIPIGDMTITERIIEQFAEWGCREFYLILNHKAGMIRAYFEELEKNYEIHFLEETQFLGTGGGLSLLKGKVNSTFILSNCDVLVQADYDCILKTHLKEKNVITFVAAMKNMTIPYGILTTTSTGQIVEMHEKPEMSFLTNTGVYILQPEVITDLQENEFIHITDIAQNYMKKEKHIGVFPVSGKSWLDMGQFNEMEIMLKELGIDG